MPLPIAHALTGAALAEAVLPSSTPHRGRCVLIAGALAVAPDLDFIAVWGLHLERSWHRGFTHSIAFAVLVGVLLHVWLGRTRWRETVAYSVALLSHGILDGLTTATGRGVEIFWPFSEERWKLDWVPLTDPLASGAPLLRSLGALLSALGMEIAMFLPLFLLVLLLRRALSR